MLPKILSTVTLSQWRSCKVGKRTFSRSKIVSRIDIVENSLSDALNVMHENVNAFSLVAIANRDRTQIQAALSTTDLLKYMVTNY